MKKQNYDLLAMTFSGKWKEKKKSRSEMIINLLIIFINL